jgi:hypothetical protein
MRLISVEKNTHSIGLVHSCKTYIKLSLLLIKYTYSSDSCVLVQLKSILYSTMFNNLIILYITGLLTHLPELDQPGLAFIIVE